MSGVLVPLIGFIDGTCYQCPAYAFSTTNKRSRKQVRIYLTIVVRLR